VGADAKLIALFAVLHLIGMGLGAVLLVMFLRSDSVTVWSPPDEEGGGGGNDRVPPRPPGPSGGGPPLVDARPARIRLREPRRLTDLAPVRERRPAHAPGDAPIRPRAPARRRT
jgi:hypothetical protein